MATKKRKSAYTPPPSEITNRAPKRATQRRTQTVKGSSANRTQMRAPKPATWKGQFRLAPFILLLFVAVQYILPSGAAKTASDATRLFMAFEVGIVMTAVFIPFDYWLKRNRYRVYLRRLAAPVKKTAASDKA